MTEDQNKQVPHTTRLLQILAPERVAAFIQELSSHLSRNGSSVAHIMPLAWRIGHLAMEPHALWELFEGTHDRQIIVIPSTSLASHSAGVRSVIEPFITIAETANKQTLLMGHLDAGTLDVSPFTWYQRGPTGLLDDYIKFLNTNGRQPRHFPISEAVSSATRTFCERRSIAESDRIVVLNVRDRNFLPEQDTHFYRTADIATYEPAIRYLLDQGYWVLRTGVAGSVDAPFTHPRYLDIWKEPDYTDLLDPGLIARSRFGITCSSGPEALFRILGTPQLMVNGVLQSGMWMNPHDKLVFKNYRTIDNGKPARLRSMLEKGVALFSDIENVARCGYAVENNTAEQILEAVIEMDMSLSGEHRPDETANRRFLEIGSEYQAFIESKGHPADRRSVTRRATQFGYALPWTQLADSYVKSSPDFLE